MVSQNIIHGDSLLQAVDLFKEYTNGVRTVPVLRGINLAIAKGEIVVIVGASGAGKSTLLHILGILDTPTSGSVLYNGVNLTRLSEKKQADMRNRFFGFVFQFYHLLPDFTALENVLLPCFIGNRFFRRETVTKGYTERAISLLERVGLGDRLTHKPSQLSGGERQRVAIIMLARRDDGFTSYNVAIGIAVGGDRETEAGSIFSLANKAYYCGILDRILIAIPELSQEMKQLGRKQRIRVIDGERTGQLFSLKARPPVRTEEPVRFGTKADLVKSLADRGYGVKEKARVRGRSGIEYTFDILARSKDDQVEHRVAIDFLNGDKEVSLDQVMLFDTKAYGIQRLGM